MGPLDSFRPRGYSGVGNELIFNLSNGLLCYPDHLSNILLRSSIILRKALLWTNQCLYWEEFSNYSNIIFLELGSEVYRQPPTFELLKLLATIVNFGTSKGRLFALFVITG